MQKSAFNPSTHSCLNGKTRWGLLTPEDHSSPSGTQKRAQLTVNTHRVHFNVITEYWYKVL